MIVFVGAAWAGYGTTPGTWVVGPTGDYTTLDNAMAKLEDGAIPPGSTLLLQQTGTFAGSWIVHHDVIIAPVPGDLVTIVPDPYTGTGIPTIDGVFRADGAVVEVRDLTIDGKGAYRIGHAANAGELRMVNVDALQGAVDGADGGAYSVDGTSHLELAAGYVYAAQAIDSLFTTVGRGGAASVAAGGSLHASSTRFEGNRAAYDGGALWCQGTCEVEDSQFVGNVSDSGGGGAVWLGYGPDHVLRNDRFCGNTALAGLGGALLIDVGALPADLGYDVFFGNISGMGGGAIWSLADAIVVNGDFIENSGEPGGAIGSGAGTLDAWNGIFVTNHGYSSVDEGGGQVVVHSALVSGDPGVALTVDFTGVLVDPNPGFVGYLPGMCEESDLHLLPTSPARGSGDAMYDDDMGAFPCAPAGSEIPGNGIDDTCDGFEECFVDVDDDDYGTTSTSTSIDMDCDGIGEAPVDGDCDDGDDAFNPGAYEDFGDGVDQNCDGFEACWVDADADGYGGTEATSVADPLCFAAFTSPVDGDCDDANAALNPGEPEVCDGLDQNCDLVADDGAPPGDGFADADGDGYGDPEVLQSACGPDATGVPSAGDCDDHDDTVHPGAADPCGGRDGDCDAQSCEPPEGVSDDDPEGEGVVSIVGGVCGCGSGSAGSTGVGAGWIAVLAVVRRAAPRRRDR